ncbi:50S ribosomal protein L23 [Marichromatium gracile]|uniref:Large ribosomal subunit protein uL23 n=1 Tax=Marichromatium gracile TaxID=1048 RepID=A0A4R4A4A3_MARGR|nr:MULTISPECIES: 50S ribosomal protein L23 [Marichromatium]MBO8084730.1 50S ribosomal protein L23 [Marichromatium sp.]KXX64972.1 50S ribosomal protein L23 [Marichromatium gracile]MBK1708627.1 50S ribosomal protein L23 [Marichromatium gracile]MCF1184396.1 50S ribosomal protein L23 [Marichromatium gracile]RNE88589.1 50S ribosomal protein L23 [Marichromatium sp. AB31]
MNKERLMKVLLAPIVSEKSTRAAESGQVVFRVATDATKREVSQAVELLFEVKVDSVQILNVKGKTKRFGQRLGKRQDWRKAYVRLEAGQDIDFGGGA